MYMRTAFLEVPAHCSLSAAHQRRHMQHLLFKLGQLEGSLQVLVRVLSACCSVCLCTAGQFAVQFLSDGTAAPHR